MKSPEKLYSFHVKNLKSIELAYTQVFRALKQSIRERDQAQIQSYERLTALLIGVWAECRLKKLLFESNGFSDSERNEILKTDTQYEMWLAAIELAFRLHYAVPKAVLSQSSLSFSIYSKYIEICNIVQNDLRPIIELRNKLAHGQWIYPLNNVGDRIAQPQMNMLRQENALSLNYRKSLISHLSDIIHDLVVSKQAFDRDFDKHYNLIVQTRHNLEHRKYADYEATLVASYQRRKGGNS